MYDVRETGRKSLGFCPVLLGLISGMIHLSLREDGTYPVCRMVFRSG